MIYRRDVAEFHEKGRLGILGFFGFVGFLKNWQLLNSRNA